MLVIFKHPRKLHVPGPDGGKLVAKLYLSSPLPQEVPDSCEKNWFFKALVKVGDVSIVPAALAAAKDEKPPEKPKDAAPSQSQKPKAS